MTDEQPQQREQKGAEGKTIRAPKAAPGKAERKAHSD